ncbi:radial spoke head protein 3 homolog [Rhynchocyon petersi]
MARNKASASLARRQGQLRPQQDGGSGGRRNSRGRHRQREHVGQGACHRRQRCRVTLRRGRPGRQHHHPHSAAPTASDARALLRRRRGAAHPEAGSASCGRSELPGVTARPPSSALLGNRRPRSGLALGSAGRSAPALSREPRVPPACLLASSGCLAESLPPAALSPSRLPRRLSAHLPQGRLPRKTGRPRPAVSASLPDSRRPAMSTYTYTSRPRALPCQRRRYRDSLLQPSDEPLRWGNIMYDRRVIRGNTYARRTLPVVRQQPDSERQRQQQAKQRALLRRQARDQLRPHTPEPVEGRKHVDVQTELYLEEIADRIIEVDMECQTDAFLDKPSTPLFIPAKTGKDVATQILEGELFDFDLEVKPMLEVLVGKTIEQALLEVMEEEELANLKISQYEYEELRNVERAEVQRLEEQERRHREEKERRKHQQWEIVHKQTETSQKIAARAFAQRFLSDLLPSVFGSLRDGGYFYDPIERDIELGFLPWLLNEVDKTMEHSMVGRTVLDMLIRDVVEKRLDTFAGKTLHQASYGRSGGPEGPHESLQYYELQPDARMWQSQKSQTGPHHLSRAPYEEGHMERGQFEDKKDLGEGFLGHSN